GRSPASRPPPQEGERSMIAPQPTKTPWPLPRALWRAALLAAAATCGASLAGCAANSSTDPGATCSEDDPDCDSAGPRHTENRCDAPAERGCRTICGSGRQRCEDGEWGLCD